MKRDGRHLLSPSSSSLTPRIASCHGCNRFSLLLSQGMHKRTRIFSYPLSSTVHLMPIGQCRWQMTHFPTRPSPPRQGLSSEGSCDDIVCLIFASIFRALNVLSPSNWASVVKSPSPSRPFFSASSRLNPSEREFAC